MVDRSVRSGPVLIMFGPVINKGGRIHDLPMRNHLRVGMKVEFW